MTTQSLGSIASNSTVSEGGDLTPINDNEDIWEFSLTTTESITIYASSSGQLPFIGATGTGFRAVRFDVRGVDHLRVC